MRKIDPSGTFEVDWARLGKGALYAGIGIVVVGGILLTAGALAGPVAGGIALALGEGAVVAGGAATAATGAVEAVGLAAVAYGSVELSHSTSEVAIEIATGKDSRTGKAINNGDVSEKLGGVLVGWAAVGLGRAFDSAFGSKGVPARLRQESAEAVASGTKKNPVGASTYEPASGTYHRGINTQEPIELPPVLKEKAALFDEFQPPGQGTTHPNYYARPGQQHAELNSVASALAARKAALGREMSQGDLSALVTDIRRPSGVAVDRCPRCSFILDGIELTPQTRSAEKAWTDQYLRGDFDPSSPLP